MKPPVASTFSYIESAYPVPAVKVEAYRQAWDWLAAPGSWWTGAERVAIAAETRAAPNCALCQARRQALSPLAVEGQHDSVSDAALGASAERAIEAVHRIRTDPARLTQSWIEDLLGEDFGYGHYVELVGVLVTVLSIDAFHETLGLPLEPLPEPLAGEPNGYQPPGASLDVAWVPMIYPENLSDAEADIYFGAPRMGNVIRAMSLVPDNVRMLHTLSAAQYLPTPSVMDMAAGGELAISRPQIELVAARTSALNDCFY